MTCAGCAARIQSRLTKTDGVLNAGVNFASRTARVEFDPNRISTVALSEAIRSLGFTPLLPDSGSRDTANPSTRPSFAALAEANERNLFWRFVVALAFSLPLLVIAMSHGAIPALAHPNMIYVQWFLATPVVFWAGWPFFVSTFRQLRHASSNMDTLIALGSGSAYAFSVYAVLAHVTPLHTHSQGHASPHVYFEAAAVIITMVLLGKLLESRATSKASGAIAALTKLRPSTARIRRNGSEIDVPVQDVMLGDTCIIRPGEHIPVDGVVLTGTTEIDESMLTGESMPVAKSPGHEVFAATLNTLGAIELRVTRIGRQTAFERIVDLVHDAQSTKAPIARFADRVSGVFVPIVLLLAILTATIWLIFGEDSTRFQHALSTSIAVLVIACPCALGLATPTAIMVGLGNAARRGILIKSATVLERVPQLDTLLFDKTGTLTIGRPSIAAMHPVGGTSADVLLAAAATVEQRSEHPIAKAVVHAARERGLALDSASDVSITPGAGVRGQSPSGLILVGTEDFLRSSGILMFARKPVAADASDRDTLAVPPTIIYVARAGRLLGAIHLHDSLKPNAATAITNLRAHTPTLQLLSGDNPAVVAAIAKAAGLESAFGGVTPAGKLARVSELQAAGHVVGMVGDGINDAPALTKADVGIAMGSGVDAALNAASVTLLRSDLQSLVDLFTIAHQTMRTIRQNLFLAMFYNVLSIPIAAGALYPFFGWLLSPMVASAAMALSSVSVVANSLLAQRNMNRYRS